MASLVKFWDGDFEGSSASIERALAINPNFGMAYVVRGLGDIYSGKPLDALPGLELSLRMDPLLGHIAWHFIGTAYLVSGQYKDAVDAFNERIHKSPDTDLTRGLSISALGHLGHIDEARRVWRKLKQINPKYSFTGHIVRLPFRNLADADKI